jgi:predicted RNA-binding protein with RPS1 domain
MLGTSSVPSIPEPRTAKTEKNTVVSVEETAGAAPEDGAGNPAASNGHPQPSAPEASEPHEREGKGGGRGDVAPELLRLLDLAARIPELVPPLAELCFKLGHTDLGNRAVRLGLEGGGVGLEHRFVAASAARREGRWTDALTHTLEAVEAFAAAAPETVAGDDGNRLLHLIRLGFATLLFDLKDPHGAPDFIAGLARLLPGLEPRLGQDPFFHALTAQLLWYQDKDRSEAEWDRAVELGDAEMGWNARGTWYKDAERDLDKAERAYRAGLKKVQHSALLMHNLAQVLVEKAGRSDVSLDHARRMLREAHDRLKGALREDAPKGLRRHVHATLDRLNDLRASLPPGRDDSAPSGGGREGHAQAAEPGNQRETREPREPRERRDRGERGERGGRGRDGNTREAQGNVRERDGNTRDGNVRERDGNTRDGNLREGSVREGNPRDANLREGNVRDDANLRGERDGNVRDEAPAPNGTAYQAPGLSAEGGEAAPPAASAEASGAPPAAEAAPEEPPRKEPEVGEVIRGRVVSLTHYGAFISMGGRQTGLLHKSAMAHTPVQDPAEVVKVGEEVEVKVIEVRREGGRLRVGLSRSALLPPPEPSAAQEGASAEGGRPAEHRGPGRGGRPGQGGRPGGGPGGRPREARGGHEGPRPERGDRPEARRDDRRPERQGGGDRPQGGPAPAPSKGRFTLGEMLMAKLNEVRSKKEG